MNRTVTRSLPCSGLAGHSQELCEDVGNAVRRLLYVDECECPCHQGEERAMTLKGEPSSSQRLARRILKALEQDSPKGIDAK